MTTETVDTYTAAIAARDVAFSRRDAENLRHAQALAECQAEIVAAETTIHVAEQGFDPDVYAEAERFLEIRWARTLGRGQRIGDRPYTGPRKVTTEVLGALAAAIEDVRHGAPALATSYYGVKEYDRWDSQAENHQYGYGPKHGHIWFSVGLRAEMRQREWLPSEIRACAAWLTALSKNPELLP